MRRALYNFGSCAVLSVILGATWAADTANSSLSAPAKTVELFAGMDSNEIEAVMVLADSTKGTIMIKNRTDQPLTVKIPAALAGVPILAQRGGGRGGGGMGGMGGMGGGRGGMGMQGMGGGMMGGMGMGGMGMGGMGGMGMGGMFNIAPEKVQKIKIAAVCLEHGKTDPSPRVPYKPIPLESYAKDPAVVEVVKLMCSGQLDQPAAQAASWNLQNGLTWEELAKKIGVKHIDGRIEPYFTSTQLQRAFAATRIAKDLAERAAQQRSPDNSSEAYKISQRGQP